MTRADPKRRPDVALGAIDAPPKRRRIARVMDSLGNDPHPHCAKIPETNQRRAIQSTPISRHLRRTMPRRCCAAHALRWYRLISLRARSQSRRFYKSLQAARD